MDETLRIHAQSANNSFPTDSAPEFSDLYNRPIGLNQHVLTILGREGGDTVVSLPDPSIELRHCLIASWKAPNDAGESNATRRFFLVDCQTKTGTFVNRKRINAVELHAGDFIQIGPFAWSFSAEDCHLVPLPPIDGVGLSLDGIHVKQRLGPNLNMRIEPGTFVAIVGDSGAGKSTLIKILAGQQGSLTQANVTVFETNGKSWARESNLPRFRTLLGYVSQDSVLHEELSSEQLLNISAHLRRESTDEEDLKQIVDIELLRFELKHRRDLPISKLSGGENKRLRVANELTGEPRLLILDEPDSGLDGRRRRQLMQLLRARSWQGCTVILITHEIADLDDQCDRIIRLASGQIVCDKTLNFAAPRSRGEIAERRPVPWWRQTTILLRRETRLQIAKFTSRIILPIGIALLFALAIGVAVPHGELALLGFLAIISVIWMSASLSLLSIAGEREVLDHERHLFLRISSYLIAKTLVLLILSTLQSFVFFIALWLIRYHLGRNFLDSPWLAFVPLVLVGWSGMALGLFLSAVAGRRKETATYVLPLIMVAQIVFSIPIAEHTKVRDTVRSAYSEFHWQMCENRCGEYASIWVRNQGNGALRAVCKSSCDRWPESKVKVHPKAKFNPAEIRWAALASYLTISRPADIALRQSAYGKQPPQDLPQSWQGLGPIAQICGWAIGLLVATAALLKLQS